MVRALKPQNAANMQARWSRMVRGRWWRAGKGRKPGQGTTRHPGSASCKAATSSGHKPLRDQIRYSVGQVLVWDEGGCRSLSECLHHQLCFAPRQGHRFAGPAMCLCIKPMVCNGGNACCSGAGCSGLCDRVPHGIMRKSGCRRVSPTSAMLSQLLPTLECCAWY